ncbi:MAG TPA: hypothetical protein PLI53_12370 [Geobacteraceae bacterium]|nr:hypothetical protein [Geobacteraceae bacterium]
MHDADIRGLFNVFASGWKVLCSAFVVLILNGCVFQPFARLNDNLRAMKENCYIAGTVYPVAREQSKVFVAAYGGAVDGVGVVATTCVNQGGYFAFFVPRERKYCVAAFEDRNETGAYEPGEASVLLCGAKEITVGKDTKVVRSDLTLDSAQVLPDWLTAELSGPEINEQNSVHVTFGEVTDLDNPLFSDENGKIGLWTPFDFISNAGIGVYFLEPYDPLKIPILFIYGAGGCPRDWAYFIDNMDRKRYQPWIFFYPSGERLGSVATILHGIVGTLRTRYHFSELFVTAHSMGGLIARDLILRQGAEGDVYVKLLVTLSTPWSGLESAKLGVTFAPAAVPCWYDIQAGSPYIEELFKSRMPPDVSSFLLFSYRGDRNPLSENNDGIVTLKSQLRWEAQDEAAKVYGFNQEHESILVNRDVFDVYARILEEAGHAVTNMQ